MTLVQSARSLAYAHQAVVRWTALRALQPRHCSHKPVDGHSDNEQVVTVKNRIKEDPLIQFYNEFASQLDKSTAARPPVMKPTVPANGHGSTRTSHERNKSTVLSAGSIKSRVKLSGTTADGKKIVPTFTVYGRSDGSTCSGCGGMISSDPNVRLSHGIVGGVLEVSKAKSRKLRVQNFMRANKALCQRCKTLKSFDNSTNADKIERLSVIKADPINASIFASNVAKIKHYKAWAVHVVDATDFDSTIIRAVRDTVGSNPLLLAVTKADLLPVNINDDRVANSLIKYFRDRCKVKGLNCHRVFLLSGKLNTGVGNMVEYVLDSLNGKDVYVFGHANTGKSTLVNAFIQQITQRRGIFIGEIGRKRKKILSTARTTASNLPGTTLVSIRIPCFASHRHALWDTPGLFPQRYDWFQGSKPVVASEPKMLSPVILPSYPASDSIEFTIKDMRLRVEMKRDSSAVGNGKRGVVWYSNYNLTPVTAALPHNMTTMSTESAPETDALLFKTFSPQLENRYRTYAADIVFFDLGWLALCFDSPHEVKVYVSKSANVAVRPVQFHPFQARAQLKYIKECRERTVEADAMHRLVRDDEENSEKEAYVMNTVVPTIMKNNCTMAAHIRDGMTSVHKGRRKSEPMPWRSRKKQ